MRKIIYAVMILLLTNQGAFAACTKPVGLFVGAGSGSAYDLNNGNLLQLAAISLSVNILSNGSATVTEKGKNISGVYTTSYSVASSSNVFSTSTCTGTFTTSTGLVYTYTSSLSGSVINFIYTKNDNVLALYTLRLEKA